MKNKTLLLILAALIATPALAQNVPNRKMEFTDGQELQRRDSAIDGRNTFTRLRLIKTELKYPFVRCHG